MAQLTADEYVLCLSERYQSNLYVTFTDESPYGVSTELRGDKARYLVGARMDEDQNLTFFPISNPTPLETLSWTPNNPGDGGIRLFYFNILEFDSLEEYEAEISVDNVITTYPNIIFTGTGATVKLWIPLQDVPAGIEPEVTSGWEDYWVLFPSTNLYLYINSDKLLIHIHDDLITVGYEDCVRENLDEVGDDILYAKCKDNDFLVLLKQATLLDAANSLNWQDKTPRADYTLQTAIKKFCSC